MSVPARQFPLHTFIEGERVHYRSLTEVEDSLNEGYLELETVLGGDLVHMVIRLVDGEVTLSDTQAGMLSVNLQKAATVADLKERYGLDLHAFRWYPHREVAPSDYWLLGDLHSAAAARQHVKRLLTSPSLRPFWEKPVEEEVVDLT